MNKTHSNLVKYFKVEHAIPMILLFSFAVFVSAFSEQNNQELS